MNEVVDVPKRQAVERLDFLHALEGDIQQHSAQVAAGIGPPISEIATQFVQCTILHPIAHSRAQVSIN